MTYPYITQQTIGEPLANPWYTPGWTSQNPLYQLVPTTPFTLQPFPTGAIYITVSGSFFDNDGNPIGGSLTFYPSAALTLTSGSNTIIIPQRFVGQNLFDIPGAWWGTGYMYLRNGALQVSLLATDNAGVSMVPATFTYHVTENWLGGRQYDITVPSTSTSPVDINTLIVPGSIVMSDGSSPIQTVVPDIMIQIAAVSTVYLPADITASLGGSVINPTSDEIDFAFIAGSTEPQSGDWHVGSWVSGGPPYIAQILIGPSNGGLVLAKGSYIVWCRVIATPQVPIFPVGTLTIY